MSWARRTDANHAEIREALHRLGWLVLDLSRVGQGCPDLLGCHRRHGLTLFEIKTARGTLTGQQSKLISAGWPVVVLRSVDDAKVFTQAVGAVDESRGDSVKDGE